MKNHVIAILSVAVMLGTYGCDEVGPEPDAQLHGHIAIYETMGRGALVHLVNGREDTQLLLDENTQLVRTFQEDGETPMWYFDSVYRVDRRMNWAPEEYFDENEDLTVLRLARAGNWIWAMRIERLDESDSDALIESGDVMPRESEGR